MKTRIIALIVMLVSGTIACKAQWKFTPEAGMNISSLWQPSLSDAQIGVRAGVAVKYEFKFYGLGIQSGLYYSQKGGRKINFGYAVQPGLTENIRLDYLQLPVLATFNVKLADNIKLYVNAGPYLAYGISGARTLNNGYKKGAATKIGNPFKDYNIQNEAGAQITGKGFNRLDWGVSFGTGIAVGHWNIGANYDLGLGKVQQDTGKAMKHSHNRTWNATLGYTF